MLLTNIESAEQITDDQVNYLAGIAQTLSAQNDFLIQSYSDTLLTSPDAQKVLQDTSTAALLKDEPPQGVAFDAFNKVRNGEETFALSLYQENSLLSDMGLITKGVFSSLRRKVKRIFCGVVSLLQSEKNLDLKQIIKDVLLVLVPALAASTGLLPIALPIVVSLAAMLLKYGVSKVCPV